jgi:hypothetical protein
MPRRNGRPKRFSRQARHVVAEPELVLVRSANDPSQIQFRRFHAAKTLVRHGVLLGNSTYWHCGGGRKGADSRSALVGPLLDDIGVLWQ